MDDNFTLKDIKNLIKIDNKLQFTDEANKLIDKLFVEQFGELALEEFDYSYRLKHLIMFLSADLDIEPVLLQYDEIKEDSILLVDELPYGPYVVVNSKMIIYELEVMKCLIHETRHYYQYHVINNNIEHPLKELWIEDLEKNSLTHPENDEELANHISLSVELDAFAYTKYILKLLYDIDYEVGGEEYTEVLDRYVEKYLLVD